MTGAMRFHLAVLYFVMGYVVGDGETEIFVSAVNDVVVCTLLLGTGVYQLVRGCDTALTVREARRAG